MATIIPAMPIAEETTKTIVLCGCLLQNAPTRKKEN
jgi:hypothetical protein